MAPLPGGFVKFDKVYYCWATKTWEHFGSQYKLEYGGKDEVIGPATNENQVGKGHALPGQQNDRRLPHHRAPT